MRVRSIIALVIFASGIATIVMLLVVARGEAISQENQAVALRRLVELYIPLLCLTASFLYGRRTTVADAAPLKPSSTMSVIAVATVTFWCLTPVAVFLPTRRIENAIALLDTLRPLGDAVVMTVLGFYFSKESSTAAA